MKTLADVRAGENVEICKVGELAMRNRFLEFGFVVGRKLHVIACRFGSVLLKIGGTVVAIDKQSAKQIFVEQL